ncbi:MAG: FecR domain-containing protein [Prevotella sp.]|nr:FecR domain-containing protein [Prevotella sp.]
MGNYYDILIVRHLLGIISDDEEDRLEAWRRKDAANEALFQKMLQQEITKEEYERYAAIDTKKAWEQFVAQTKIEDTTAKGVSMQPSLRRIFRYAAAVVAVVAIGAAGWWYADYTKVTPPVIAEEVQQAMRQSEVSGKQEAKIEKLKELAVADKAQVAAIQEELEQFDISEDVVEELLAANRVTTYHDKEFWARLDDKTLVHLNYNTKLIYPEKFHGDTRDVILEGEAYFMVAKDKSRPFIVHTPNGDVTVHGTEFNVNTRVNDNGNGNRTEVVLVEGSVSVMPVDGMEKMLQPGEMALLSSSERRATIMQVDVDPYVAWNSGTFAFNDMPLSRIMDVIARWYNMEVTYESDDLRDLKFSGEFDRYGGISPIIKGLNMAMDLNSEARGKKIRIRK